MAEMGSVNVGSPGGSGTVAGIPGKYLLLGLGGLGVAFLLLRSKGGAASAGDGNLQPASSTSGMLSSLQQLQLQQYGDITKLFSGVNDSIAGVSSHLDTQAAALGDVANGISTGFGTVGSQITANQAEADRNFNNLWSQISGRLDTTDYGINWVGRQGANIAAYQASGPPQAQALTSAANGKAA